MNAAQARQPLGTHIRRTFADGRPILALLALAVSVFLTVNATNYPVKEYETTVTPIWVPAGARVVIREGDFRRQISDNALPIKMDEFQRVTEGFPVHVSIWRGWVVGPAERSHMVRTYETTTDFIYYAPNVGGVPLIARAPVEVSAGGYWHHTEVDVERLEIRHRIGGVCGYMLLNIAGAIIAVAASVGLIGAAWDATRQPTQA
ncbi:hypothetical protein A2853_02540 [Candidatus Kaiserbacteria bacterium RIFCSPHIGHO2_01_FULL_55_17]|uniref:Uncharacterized protein n=1 Tax=Candidatus Kaiserbacteria bacterium RIFCSPHIGHO2_01_FULL_55_17 TaxID=1798484 RepID=A0A1F6D7M9_9BACT|nr:MAG: hypothetical protein A2853_02540 [Candidatus Kaiserbacteria bacterium RIFCSPHIGHO2_01_FULL_55_17]